MTRRILSISAFAVLLCLTSVSAQAAKVAAVANIVAEMAVAIPTKAGSWLCLARSLLLRPEWSAAREPVGTRGGGAAGRTRPV